jgi:hypothetical protein
MLQLTLGKFHLFWHGFRKMNSNPRSKNIKQIYPEKNNEPLALSISNAG